MADFESATLPEASDNDITETATPATTNTEENDGGLLGGNTSKTGEGEEGLYWEDKLNLVGHCAVCMGTVTSLGGSRRGVEEMNHLWPYLREDWKEEYVSNFTFILEKGRNRDCGESKVPPLCGMCRDSLKILDRLHQDKLNIQRKIDIQAGAIRRMMLSGKFDRGFIKFARNLKKTSLPTRCISNTVEFLSRLHGRNSEELESLISSVEAIAQELDEKPDISHRKKKTDFDQDSMDAFLDDSTESNLHPDASMELSPSSSASPDNRDDDDDDDDYEPEENIATDNEEMPGSVPPIKMEPTSDREDICDSNDYMEMDSSNVSNSIPSKGKSKPCPKSVKDKRASKGKSGGKGKSRKGKRSLETSGSESEGAFKRVKIKKEIQTDEEYVTNEDSEVDNEDINEEDSCSDWDGGGGRKRKRSNKRKSSTSSTPAKKREVVPKRTDEFKYKTHSRKKCEVCMEKLPLSILFEHLQSHVKDYACKCQNCGQSFMSKHRLEVYHYQKWPKCRMAAGLPPPPWTKKCEICDFTSDSHVSLRSHLQKHEVPTEKNFTCPFRNCSASFCLRTNVEFHLEKHYNQGSSSAASQRCPICAKCIEYDAQVDMKSHLQKAHKLKEVFACRGCPHVYHDRDALVKHIFPRHQKEGIRCDICTDDDVKFYKENQLREHYFNTHAIGTKHICDICEYVGFGPKQLQKHKWYKHKNGELSTPLKTFRCEICNDPAYEYKSKDALTSHNIKVHGAEPFSCKICGDTFETKNRWWRHEKTHLGPIEPRYKCEFCQKQFNVANKLKDHVDRVHLKAFVNTFKCDQCDKSYSDICGLRYHKSAVHLGIKYVCPYEGCGQSFAAPGALKTHQRRHTGERPYKCHLCPNTFRQPDAYKRHLFCHETLGEKFKPKKTNDRKFKKDIPPAAVAGPST